ncbi:DUF3137 domain-containing protein [Streptomyces sp. AS02]|uniref:DUF3137 domain-containing protein n=1 Tax=Streptomyces sp. AS02 TaxID=2938946 RepID=UPI0020209C8D|nr:DUF3137 domain-containing protein [Streptomyces sp. AS02]MCL8015836.1 DUF3137 domain-containing protein [Streptomyces sp. AS02]
MEDVLEVLMPTIVALVTVAGIIGVIYNVRRVNKRDVRSEQEQAELVHFAQERGWNYTAEIPGGAERYVGAPPFRAKGHYLWDRVDGEFRGHTFSCFEYRPRDFDAEDAGTNDHRYFVAFTLTTPTPTPGMIVDQPNMLERADNRFNNAFGLGDKEVKLGSPEFDEDFRILTDDEPFARTVMTDELLRFLLSDPRVKDGPLRFHGNELITWFEGRLRPDGIDPKLNYLCDVLERVPAQTWHSA